MANLSGQTIQSTYPGLLNLNTATTGITSTPQAITDGLGNNTGARIGTNFFEAPNLINFNRTLRPDYMGSGLQASTAANPAGLQNRLFYNLFYDTGYNSFSAVTYNLQTLSTTSDAVTFYVYTLQTVPLIGYAPKDLVFSASGLITTGTTGFKTTTFASNFSLSGTGGGYYVYGFSISNASVTPTVRFGNRTPIALGLSTTLDSLGFFLPSGGTASTIAGRGNPGASSQVLGTNILSSYTESDVSSQYNPIAPGAWGMLLNVVK